MKLPSLKFSIPFIFLCWCIAGTFTHGAVILAYPAMWAVVGLLFYGLHLVTASPTTPVSTVVDSTAEGALAQPVSTSDESPTDHHISAPV